MDVEDTVVARDGHRLACVRSGPLEADTVLLAHGISTDRDESGFYVDLAARLVSRGWHVLRFDFRGHGRSSGSPEDVSLSGELEDLLAVRRSVGPRPVACIAASFSASAAVHAAAVTSFSKLVLINPILDYPGIFIHGQSQWGAAIVDSARSLAERHESGRIYARLPDSRFVISHRLRREIEADDTVDALRRLDVPTLLLHGDADPLVPVAPAQQLRGCRDNLRIVIYPGARHGLKAVRAEATTKIVYWLSDGVSGS